VIAGADNTETNSTSLCRLSVGACGFTNAALLAQFDGANGKAVVARANGSAGTGVESFGGVGGTGVLGTHFGSTTGIGVHGRTGGVGSGVYGEATGNGVGVFGDTTDGTGVIARSTSGIALDVRGKATFSRSGTATVAGTTASPKSSVTVTNVALTAKSLILVTEQKNVAGTWVRAAVPNVANSRFTLFLNKNVSVSFPVAWMVVEKP
jgi:hypothetical protein